MTGSNKRILLLILSTRVASACQEADPPEGWIYGNGRIEANEVRVSAKISGRIAELAVRESDPVTRDEILAQLSTREWEARIQQARAEVRAAVAARTQAEARVSTLTHHVNTARVDFDRMAALYRSGAASAQQRDQADSVLHDFRGQLEVARADVGQMEARIAAAKAAEIVVQSNLEESRVVSPLDGIVLLKLVEEGEVVQPGQRLLVLIDPQELFLKVYVPERDIGKVELGAEVRIRVDSFPDRVFEGSVSEVAQRAEFTPRDVHMPDERTRLVFGVKIRLENPGGYLKPGMPADAEISWRHFQSHEK